MVKASLLVLYQVYYWSLRRKVKVTSYSYESCRYYGHPNMIQYIERLGQRAKAAGLPYVEWVILPCRVAGGFGHASHQMGLSTDIWWNGRNNERRCIILMRVY